MAIQSTAIWRGLTGKVLLADLATDARETCIVPGLVDIDGFDVTGILELASHLFDTTDSTAMLNLDRLIACGDELVDAIAELCMER
jgi:hypothetical protein